MLCAVTSFTVFHAVILKDAHYMLFYLSPAIQPRMLVTFDEELNPLPVTVRVGQVREGRGRGRGREGRRGRVCVGGYL